jgi:CPA1 family monovalent cation:H+ antiporter
MSPLALFAIMLTLAAVFGVINHRTLRLPNSIGVLLISLLVTLIILAADPFIPAYDLRAMFQSWLGTIDLPQVLLNGVLSFLLFAGALQVHLPSLWDRKFSVLALALLGTSVSVVLFGGGMWLIFPLVGQPVSLIWCIVLGAILAPTDPVSVVGMLRRIGLPPSLQAVFAGESLLNDGVGVVAFGVALSVATGDGSMAGVGEIAHRFCIEAVGGGLIGLGCGCLAVLLIRAVDDAHLELMISLALATGTFSAANALGVSGPIAVVIAGLAMGTKLSRAAISRQGHEELTSFWSLVDEVLNAILFLLIGLEVVAIPFHLSQLAAAAVAIPLSIAVRAMSVALAMLPAPLRGLLHGPALIILTWGGLRGGISVALALGLPHGDTRASLLTVCYAVVVFTIIVQGLTIERVARRLY